MDISGILYHYTDARGLHGIIQSKQIWATSYRFMSDAREFEYGFDLISKVYPSVDISDPRSLPSDFAEKLQDSNFAELIRNWKKVYNFDGLFLASFSADGDSLGQWRGYAGLHSGYSLGFSSSDLISIDSETHLVICCYNEEQQKTELKTLIDRYLPAAKTIMRSATYDPIDLLALATEAAKEIPLLCARFKHPAFENEKELRLAVGPIWANNERIRYRPGERVIIPYVEIDFRVTGLPLKHIIVGPGPHQERNAGSLRQMLMLHGFKDVVVSLSVVPFRTW